MAKVVVATTANSPPGTGLLRIYLLPPEPAQPRRAGRHQRQGRQVIELFRWWG